MRKLPDPVAARKPAPADPALAADFRRFHGEAAGLVDVRIARAHEFAEIALAAEMGAPVARAFVGGMVDLQRKIKRFARPLCASCDATFYPKRPPAGLLLLLPATDAPTMTIVSGICAHCTRMSDAAIVEGFAAYLKKSLWPDLRLVDAAQVMREAGRA